MLVGIVSKDVIGGLDILYVEFYLHSKLQQKILSLRGALNSIVECDKRGPKFLPCVQFFKIDFEFSNFKLWILGCIYKLKIFDYLPCQCLGYNLFQRNDLGTEHSSLIVWVFKSLMKWGPLPLHCFGLLY